jgi:hypothetical protein
MPTTFKTLILALLISFSFLAVSKVAVAGSADGKAVYCECEEGKNCGNLSLSSTVFAVFFESGTVDMKYPVLGGVCGKKICSSDLKKDRRSGEQFGYEDGYEVLRWKARYFGMEYSLNRETLILTETSLTQDWLSKEYSTYYKRCEVLKPDQALEKINSYISDSNDEIDAERKEQTKKNKI